MSQAGRASRATVRQNMGLAGGGLAGGDSASHSTASPLVLITDMCSGIESR